MSRGRARLAIGKGISVWVLEAQEGFGDLRVHSHHAIQITASPNGEVTLIDASGSSRGACLAVASDAPHRLEARGLLLFIFIEPESLAGRALSAALFGLSPLAEINSRAFLDALIPLAGAFDDAISVEDMLAIGRNAVGSLASIEEPPLPDQRVLRVIEQIRIAEDQNLAEIAEAAGVYLSPSRLRHLFAEQTGLPFRTYVLWLKLMRALEIYSAGQSLTEAAHEAGFADSAHFSRTFRRTFGAPATALSRF